MLLRFFWPTLVWTLFILVFTLIPGKALPSVSYAQIDKLVHFFFFAVLMILTSYSLQKVNDNKGLAINFLMIAFLYSITLGATIEVIQLVVPGRDFSFVDIFANCIGAGIGCLVFMLFRKKK